MKHPNTIGMPVDNLAETTLRGRKSLRGEAVDLEQKLRYSLPSYALEYLEQALQGDISAAGTLVVAAPNHLRGHLAVLFYLRGAPAALQRAVLGDAWSHDHEEVISAARTKTRLEAMFKAMKFSLPSFIPEQAEVWRGVHKYGRFGVSWTLRCDVALWFARRVRIRNGEPLVLSAVVPRDNILFYEDGREEAECVIFDVGTVSSFKLDAFNQEKECESQTAPPPLLLDLRGLPICLPKINLQIRKWISSMRTAASLLEPCFLRATSSLPGSAGWFCELKLDGHRDIAFTNTGKAQL